jgi:phenylpropionate dioxygenase-like ring-hydroxylating dioxygenase large terminal subunit
VPARVCHAFARRFAEERERKMNATTTLPDAGATPAAPPPASPDSVIEHGKYFTSLPREYYLDEARFKLEVERVWCEQWVYAGHVSQIPRAGDYIVLNLQTESLIITRSSETEINAFHNVCRHRGLRLCEEAKGHFGPRIVCPYHTWSYGRDGTLLKATKQADGEFFDYADWGLNKAHVSVWQGFIFVSMAAEAPAPVDSMIDAKTTADMELIQPLRMKVAVEKTYVADANWKLLLENGVECYHCPSVHPEFCVVLNATAMSDYYAEDYLPNLVQGLIIPVKGELESLSMDGTYLSKKLLGQFGEGTPVPYEFGTGFMTQPGYAWGGFHPDYGMVASTLPISAGRSIMICQWFVHEDAVEGVDYDVEELIKIWDITNYQDLAIQERQQLGVAGRRYLPGPNSPSQEPGIRAALRKYLEMMGEPY